MTENYQKVSSLTKKPLFSFIGKTKTLTQRKSTFLEEESKSNSPSHDSSFTTLLSSNPLFPYVDTSSFSYGRPVSVPEKVFLLPKYTMNNKYSKSVKEFSYNENQNTKYKKSMEDKAKTISNFNSDSQNILFTLFDGHGGDFISTFLQHHFDKFFKRALQSHHNNNITQSLHDAFLHIDETLQEFNIIKVGSTGCVVYITKEKGKKVVYCANVGDTRCTLFTASSIHRMSYDHRADDPEERQRICSKGGIVVRGRVMGRLMLSRSFGDFELKQCGVVCEPYVSRRVIEEEENVYIVIACDGVWDVLTEERVKECIERVGCDKMKGKNGTAVICEEVIKEALEEGAWDNLSVLVIKV